MWKRRLGSALVGITLVLTPLISIRQDFFDYLNFLENRDVRNYVTQSIGGIIKIHENNLGVDFDEEPKVKWGLPKELSALAYPEQGIAVAAYDPELDTIFLTSTVLRNPNMTFSNTILKKLQPKIYKQRLHTDGIFSHELGHFFVDQEAESLEEGDWPPDFEGLTKGEVYGFQLISEGIAFYFEGLFNFNTTNTYSDSDWPINIGDWTNEDIYDGGFNLVQPIIEQYGVQGIRHLILNPLTECDLQDLPAYRTRMLDQLEKQICLEDACIQG